MEGQSWRANGGGKGVQGASSQIHCVFYVFGDSLTALRSCLFSINEWVTTELMTKLGLGVISMRVSTSPCCLNVVCLPSLVHSRLSYKVSALMQTLQINKTLHHNPPNWLGLRGPNNKTLQINIENQRFVYLFILRLFSLLFFFIICFCQHGPWPHCW